MSIKEEQRDLEHDIAEVEAALEQARVARDAVYQMQTVASGLVLDTLNFEDSMARDVESEADAMSEHAGEVFEQLDSMLGQLHNQLADLPDEEMCDDCGAVIPIERIDEDEADLHEDWCTRVF